MSIQQDLKDIDTAQKGLAKLGQTLKTQFSDASKSLSRLVSVNSGVNLLVSQTKNAISGLKELDAILTSIGRQNPSLSNAALEKIGDDALDTASKYGQKATDYLTAFQQASQAGYDNAQAFARLSLALQTAGDISSQTATQYLLAMDAAFHLGNSVKELQRILDGSSSVASHNAIGLAELTQAMALAGSQASSLGLSAQETALALAAMMASTNLSGADAAQAFSQLIQSLDGSQKADVLKAVMDSYGGYDQMLQQYADSVGSLAIQAQAAANSWEGSLNRLSNTWTDTLGNVADPGTITTTLTGLNGLLSILGKITGLLGTWKTIGAGAGIFSIFKNVDYLKMPVCPLYI